MTPHRFDDLPPAPVHPLQCLAEFGGLWNLAATEQVRDVVEVGSLYGGTLWYWLQLPVVRRVVSVDLVVPDDSPVHADVLAGRELWPTWVPHVELQVIEADSHDPATLARVAHHGPIDLLFLDGDHTYDGVAEDWRLWSPLVRPGGLVAFHDTVANGDRDEPGVRQLVGELKWRHPSVEWFDPDGVGITAVRL